MPSYARASTGTAPTARPQTLIVVQAFERNDEGDVVPAIEAQEAQDERRAIGRAKELALRHAGAIAWKRDVKPDEGEFGEPVVLFSRGLLPDLDMPIRRDDEEEDAVGSIAAPQFGDDEGGGELAWAGFRLEAAGDWQTFHAAFLTLYRQQPDQDLLAVFTGLENRRIVVLPPEAAKLVQRDLPHYQLTPCARPPTEMVSLELGHTLQLDTTWFELSAEERERRKEAGRLTPEQVLAEDAEFAELFGDLPLPPHRQGKALAAEPAPAKAPRKRRPKVAKNA